MKALVLCGGLPQIAMMKELKSRGVTVVLADMNEKVGARAYADIFYPVSTFDIPALTEVAKGLGVTLCLENSTAATPLSTLSATAQLVKEIGSESLRLSVSVGAATSHGEDFLGIIDEYSELISVVRAEDSTEGSENPLPLFEGSVNWAALAELLFSLGYSGVLSVTAPVYCGADALDPEEVVALEKRSASYAALIAG